MALWWGVISWSTSLAATCGGWDLFLFLPRTWPKQELKFRKAGLPVFIPGAWIREWFFCLWMPHLIPSLTLANHFNILCLNHQTKMSTPSALLCPNVFLLPHIWTCPCTLPHVYSLLPTCPWWLIILTTPAHYGLSFLWILIFCIWKTFCHPNPIINCDCLKKSFISCMSSLCNMT